MDSETTERLLKRMTPKERERYLSLSPAERLHFAIEVRDELTALRKMAESFEGNEEGAIAAGILVTEAEIDRRMESGELTDETAEEFFSRKIVKWNDGTYGSWKGRPAS